MAARKKPVKSLFKDDTERGRALHATTANLATAFKYTTQEAVDRPTDLNEAYRRARYWFKESSFLRGFLKLKKSIYNYGIEIKAIDPAQQTALELWLAEKAEVGVKQWIDPTTREVIELENNQTNLEVVSKLIEDSWTSFFLFDVVPTMWQDDRHFAFVLPIERTVYTDTFGVEILKYIHGLSRKDVEQIFAEDPEQKKRFLLPQIILNVAFHEHFKVLKLAALGDGYGWPSIYSLFRLLGEVESKEIGFSRASFLLRLMVRQHKLGHDIKQGPHAGKATHMWNKTWGNSVLRQFEDKEGFIDVATRHDHLIEYPFPDLKRFDRLAWEGTNERLVDWAGPIGRMLVAKGVAPYLGVLLKALALEDRAKMGNYLSTIITDAFQPPTPVRLQWSNLIFTESRLLLEAIRFAVTQGFLSTTTSKEELGFNAEKEEMLKLDEANDSEAGKKNRPIWDPSHGISPALGETAATMAKEAAAAKGAAVDSKPGKPAGTQDAS